jgi:drug/metabolite transporter (DMT)-like permease
VEGDVWCWVFFFVEEFLRTSFDWALAIFSGVSFGVALWFMYKSFATSEISHVGPLGGASISIFVVLLGSIFLHEIINSKQLVALLLLIAGSLLISLEQSKKHRGWHVGVLWVVVAGLFFASSNVAAKYIYEAYGFYSGFVWTRGFTGIVAVILLCTPTILRALRHKDKVVPFRKHNFFLIGSNKVLGGVGVLLIQYATALSSVSLVNALTGAQYAFLIVLIAAFSKFRPSVLKEVYTRAEVVQEVIAVGFIMVGVVLLV